MEILLNPTSGDYSAGQRAKAMENAIYLRLMVPLGSWWRDKNLGSRLHELAREKDLPHIHLLATQFAEQALKPLLESGEASSITVASESWHDGWLRLRVSVVDAGGTEQIYHHPVAVGG